MANRTYRYFKGKALYPFGHGLSYTTFTYSNLSIAASKNGGQLVTAKVTNTGRMDGEEVVQLYVSASGGSAPVRSLKGFQRISLKKGESRMVRFTLTRDDLSLLDEEGNPQPFRGNVGISVGGGQPDEKSRAGKSTIQMEIKR